MGAPADKPEATDRTPAPISAKEKAQEKKRPPAADALLSLDSARRRVYIFWIHFFKEQSHGP